MTVTRSISSDALAAACRRYHVARLDLFGSALTDEFDAATSDVDFLVEFEDLAPAQYADAYFGLRETLSEMFGRPVDLVTVASLANPYFRESVMARRENVFVAP